MNVHAECRRQKRVERRKCLKLREVARKCFQLTLKEMTLRSEKNQGPETFVRISQTLSRWGTKRSYIFNQFNSPRLIYIASVLSNNTDIAKNVGPTYCLARAQRPLTPFKPLSPKAKYSFVKSCCLRFWFFFKNPRLKAHQQPVL